MSEVIYVDFRRKPVGSIDQYIYEFIDALCDSCLDDNDIEDIVEAVEDYEHYKTLDDDLKAIVDRYLHDLEAF